MRSIFKRQSGIALLMVLSAIVILTILAVELSYNAQIEYHLAVRQKERLQAYYLARSAYQMTLLELKIGNAAQSQIASATSQAGVDLPIDLSAPLCQQFPIKTALFRLIASGDTGDEKAGADSSNPLAGVALQGVDEFLNFDGDFEAECLDESSKLNLNFFYAADPALKIEGQTNPYDDYKRFLIQFLSQPQFEELLKEKNVKVHEVVRNIADWVDPNPLVNEWEGSQGGDEDNPYRSERGGGVKNGKMTFPNDIFRVAGIEDDWWIPLSEYFTIYGMDNPKGGAMVNVCRADDVLVKGLILRYASLRKDLPPLNAADPKVLDALVETVQASCVGAKPDKGKIALELDEKLLELLKGSALTDTGAAPPSPVSFADWISTESRFFTLKMLGQVHDTVVKVDAVVDMGEATGPDAGKMKLVYWKVQ